MKLGAAFAFALLLTAGVPAVAAGAWLDMYPPDRLIDEQPRFAARTNQLLDILRQLIRQGNIAGDERALSATRISVPLSDPHGSLLNFYSLPSGPTVFMPVFSLLFLEDLSTAYAWLYKKGYSLETVDEYLAMLHYKPASAFPGGRYPPPLAALGIPPDAADDSAVGNLGLRFRNSAYAFILAHELGHIALGHRGYAGVSMEQARRNEAAADAFALKVLAQASEIPMGAILFFQAQAYTMPSLGQYKAEGRSAAEWQQAMRSEITHPLTADRLSAIAVALEREAAQETRPAERDTLEFIAIRLASIARALDDADLQQCVAVAAARSDPDELRPRRAGSAQEFLARCTRPGAR